MTWSEADWAFLLECRQHGGNAAPYGADYHEAIGPAVWTHSGPRRRLPEPRRLRTALDDALAQRRTVRERGILTEEAVSTLLHHTLRTRYVNIHGRYETMRKPVPSGGAMHSCEPFLVARNVEGLLPGVYWYDGVGIEHTLVRVADWSDACLALVQAAQRSMGVRRLPPAVLVLGARSDRTPAKYSRIALAAVLKDAGVIMGYLSLVGYQCRAGVCPLGGGDMEHFAAASGLSADEVVSVAEVALWGG